MSVWNGRVLAVPTPPAGTDTGRTAAGVMTTSIHRATRSLAASVRTYIECIRNQVLCFKSFCRIAAHTFSTHVYCLAYVLSHFICLLKSIIGLCKFYNTVMPTNGLQHLKC